MTDNPPVEPPTSQRQAAFMSALVTEHFVLQSAASATISESGSRASIYLGALSSSLVAIGFSTGSPTALAVFSGVLLPTLFVLGGFTLVRLVDTTVENVVALARIEAIRQYYMHLTPESAAYFPSVTARAVTTLGVRYGWASALFTTGSMVAVVNSVLGGVGTATLLSLGAGWDPRACAVAGCAVGLGSFTWFMVYQARRLASIRPLESSSPAG
jgi:hypothetical protein